MRYYPTATASAERNYYEMYQIYRIHAESCRVIRSGTGLYGASYDYREALDDALSGRRGESVAEHTYLSVVNLFALYDRFPKFRPFNPHLFLNQIHLLLVHDLAENETGDIPADGSHDNAEKTLAEHAYLEKLALHFSIDTGENLVSMFRNFNATLGTSAIPRVAEKSEAVARATLYEAAGSIGRLSYKVGRYGRISDADFAAAQATNSDLQLDIWAYSFISQFRDQPSFREFFGEILVGAMVARNGEAFPWCDPDLLKAYDLKKLRRLVDGSDEE